MAKFPVIDSPCPLRANATPQPGRDHCGHCDRKVHNLDGMSMQQRESFLRSCTGKVCVAYTVHRAAPHRNLALGASLVAAMSGSGMAMAQQAPAPLIPDASQRTLLTPSQIAAIPILDSNQIASVMVGGVLSPGDARWADESELGPAEHETLPTIGKLEWLPSKKP